MRTITCFDCDHNFSAETSEEVLKKLYTHYMAEHHEIITSVDEAGKKAWMERFYAEWAQA
ncbi:DUF1059 domain-containing protein [bacterium]|nr:DUF1059 domain-containing protein [bacterium]NCQ55387.1 DUF1059 domain-containing protein [Candidatus Parcubacteria bacterium]NCS67749.1 DUF1059 domain-containing protein [Candidatus Peregrinibacteria bacterium]NCS96437.1 DUF1059 domain-containing protein [bacterium]